MLKTGAAYALQPAVARPPEKVITPDNAIRIELWQAHNHAPAAHHRMFCFMFFLLPRTAT